MKLAGQVAVITGGGSGQGRATAELFGKEGAAVAVLDISGEGAVKTVDLMRSHGTKEAEAWQVDITDEARVEKTVGEIVQKYGRIDILVNCAGRTGPSGKETSEELTMDDWMGTLKVNLIGPWLCMKYVTPVMRKQKSGAIINVSSTAGIRAIPGASPYCASKAALSMLTKSAALEYIPWGIRVNGVLPGHIDTPMMASVIKGMEQMGVENAFEKVHTCSNPVKRLGTPEEVANIILFLAGRDASFIVGTEVLADGGFAAG